MSHANRIANVRKVLSYALASCNDIADMDVTEARMHMRQALRKLEHAGKSANRRTESTAKHHEKWWGEVVENAPKVTQVERVAIRSIQQIDRMIAEERKKIQDIDKKIQDRPADHSGDVLLD